MNSQVSLHHTHLVTNQVDNVCRFYKSNFDAEVVFDEKIDGDRNIFMTIGTGRIHLFESRNPPQHSRNSFHHLGMMVENLTETIARLEKNDVQVTAVTNVPDGRFAMATAPDNVLLELFEVNGENRKFFVA
ncbi:MULTISPECIES: VOC family protein [Rhodococcus]|uniref:VOC domain-containing protein n=1 Tax=Rhodococcus qingshengii TaxID=334542 RepID=A0A2A5IYU9_RHOSG|nr:MULTISPECIES: VOC family protein [Rhodococcus]MCQ4129182.1 VOC family protein [Rhodococcus erythropolis]MDJ0105193.1 VOC family protein [Rhodococcus erythropolis]MDV8015345.1 VOC family protein [Rhodococcus sp. IEGM 1241]PCK22433.1 hypothetical protein CHR55_32430 [Rhodococcus qingshengii]